MTKIAGNINYVGPSGGVIIPGDYTIITYPQAGPGDVSISGTNLLIEMSGPNAADGKVIIYNKGNFVVGDATIFGEETPNLFSINARQTMQVKTKDTISFNVLNDNLDVIQQLSIGTSQIQLQSYNAVRPSINSSGIATLDGNNILPRYHVSGVLSANEVNISASDNVYINGNNIHLDTLGSQRPTVNGSGIWLYGDMRYFLGTLVGGQSIAASQTAINWNSVTKHGITHTNGESRIYFDSMGKYSVMVILDSNYNIGNHQLTIDLKHFNGVVLNSVVNYDYPTLPQTRNQAMVNYIITPKTLSDYIQIFAYATTAQAGKTWQTESKIIINKIAN